MYSGQRFGNYLSSDGSEGCSVASDLNHEQDLFELDEELNNRSYTKFGNAKKPERLPLGRLRRESASCCQKPTTENVQFPAIFVEEFRSGHVAFNIPGVLCDSLKPTDSIELKFNFEFPVGTPSNSLNYDTSKHLSHTTEDTGISGRFSCFNNDQDNQSSFQIPTEDMKDADFNQETSTDEIEPGPFSLATTLFDCDHVDQTVDNNKLSLDSGLPIGTNSGTISWSTQLSAFSTFSDCFWAPHPR